MFTKPTKTPVLGFAPKTTPVAADWFNYVSNNFPDIFDATGGGTWQNVGDIVFKSSSNKFKLNYPDINHQIELRGFVTFDLTDIGGMPTSVGGFTCNLETTFNSTVVFDGASGVTFSTPVIFDTDGDITLQTGCAVTAQSGSSVTVQSGSSLTVNAGGTLQANGTTNITSTTTISGTTGVSGTITLSGRRVIRRARVVLTDANQTIDVTQGDRFVVPAVNAAPRTITLKSTAPAVPAEGECMEILWIPNAVGGAGTQYTIQREDTTVVATFVGSAITGTEMCWAEFEYTGGVWRLGAASGDYYDGAANCGVLAGAGA